MDNGQDQFSTVRWLQSLQSEWKATSSDPVEKLDTVDKYYQGYQNASFLNSESNRRILNP